MHRTRTRTTKRGRYHHGDLRAFGAGLDRVRNPALADAARPVEDAFRAAALAVSDGDRPAGEALAMAVATTVHGHAVMLHLGAFGAGEAALEVALTRAGEATRALIAGRAALAPPR